MRLNNTTTSISKVLSFNSRTREGCDAALLICALLDFRFQFTHPGGVRLSAFSTVKADTKFQFTHPGGVRLYYLIYFATEVSFNSRTREGCDPSRAQAYQQRGCFNSRTREGCDLELLKTNLQKSAFQFTHPGGVRLEKAGGIMMLKLVSIHAPGRGATSAHRLSRGQRRCFNSRTREGCDPIAGRK